MFASIYREHWTKIVVIKSTTVFVVVLSLIWGSSFPHFMALSLSNTQRLVVSLKLLLDEKKQANKTIYVYKDKWVIELKGAKKEEAI